MRGGNLQDFKQGVVVTCRRCVMKERMHLKELSYSM